MALAGEEPLKVTDVDADVLWLYDMPAELGVHAHDAVHCSILIHGRHLYLNTCNGVNRIHTGIPAPEAPSLIVLDKTTGRLVAQDGEAMGPRIFHCTWSSPSLGVIDRQPLIFFGGGDGVCYAFKALALDTPPPPQQNSLSRGAPVQTLQRVWRFDCDPSSPKENVHRYMRNRRESPSDIKGMPVFHEGRVYVTCGGDIWWGKREAWLKCIDATKTGEITKTGLIWSYPLKRHCCSTPAIAEGLVFVTDLGRNIYCLDAETGQTHWIHETRGEIYSSPLVADGKVYVGTRRQNLWVFAADKKKKILATVDLGSPMSATPVAANGVLYIATMKTLYAVWKAGE